MEKKKGKDEKDFIVKSRQVKLSWDIRAFIRYSTFIFDLMTRVSICFKTGDQVFQTLNLAFQSLSQAFEPLREKQ